MTSGETAAREAVTTVQLALLDGMHFEAQDPQGIAIELDSSPEYGGRHLGFQPKPLLLVALAGCTGMDVLSIMRKKRQHVTGYRIEVSATQTNEYPRVYTDIRVHHIVEGPDVTEDALRRAIELSETKYCPVIAMLRPTVPISSSYEIHPAVPAD